MEAVIEDSRVSQSHSVASSFSIEDRSDPVEAQSNRHNLSVISNAEDAHLLRIGAANVEPGTATAWNLTLNIVTGGLGAGILSLPWSTAGATLIPSFAIIAVVLMVNACTIIILVEAAEKKQAFDLGAVLGHLPGRLGPIMKAVTNVSVWASIFGLLIGYYIVICDSVDHVFGKDNRPAREVTLAISAAIMIPICFLDQSRLAFTSSLTVAINIYIFCLICAKAVQKAAEDKLPDICFLGVGFGTVAMVTAMTQAVIIQMCVIPMYAELQDRTPRKMRKIVIVSFSILFLIFAAFCAGGDLMWGVKVKSNVLKNLKRNVFGSIAQIGMVIVSASVYPIMFIAMIAPVRNSQRFSQHANWLTVFLVLLSAGIAYFVDNLGTMNVINGAMCVGIFTGLVPALAGVYILQEKYFLMYLLAAACFVMSVLGFYFTDNYAKDVHCLWNWDHQNDVRQHKHLHHQ